MRVWDLPVAQLCNKHLVAEHFELHVLWNVLTRGLRGWAHHPETRRWQGRLKALYRRHEAEAREMLARGLRHASPLDPALATGQARQTEHLDSLEQQAEILRRRCAECRARLGGPCR